MILRGIQPYYFSSTTQPVHKEHNDIATIYKHQVAIGRDNFIRDRLSKYFKVSMSRHYKNGQSKYKFAIWTKETLSKLTNVHLDSWKPYCNLTHENTTSANDNSQIHQDKVDKIDAIQEAQKDLMFEQTKWFDISSESFEQMNIQSINRRINIANHIIQTEKQK